ncbi:hypothetical protein Tco_1015736 [Tanacetum coccineum]|uniref:Reverse transcriptase domain-containing protein n=1 Tax=Tanacetum coccineum TaxID=301880 RepID=A0ABQ5FLQ0_9ASTR
MLTPETRMIERYIGGLSQNIKANVTSSKPTDIHETITMAHSLMDQVIQDLGEKTFDNKRKCEGNHNDNNNNKYNQNKRQEVARVYAAGPIDKEPLPEQQIREIKTTRETHLPDLVVDKKGIIGMNVQKQGTKAEETRFEATKTVGTKIRETEMEETMIKETRMGIKIAETLASWQIMLMLKERPSRIS